MMRLTLDKRHLESSHGRAASHMLVATIVASSSR